MEYDFKAIEAKWQEYWEQRHTYKVYEDDSKPPYYVLDMFPYPSGAGLHMGHPLGYTASDIYARYKRMSGFNVLHPMGFDAFGLPAEQYAIQTGQHPSVTTEQNSARYRTQLKRLGFSFDWSREINTSDPSYYKWTQWAFSMMFNSYYDIQFKVAKPIKVLIDCFENDGSESVNAACSKKITFTAKEWNAKSDAEKSDILMNYRLAYLSETMVNWCAKLGTVLANDEVSNGLSVRGGFPVEQKKMKQWLLRTSAYAERLLDGLEEVDWSESLKETQRNWIGKSEGATIYFDIKGSKEKLEIFTTRPDTIFGATFMVIAPEHKCVNEIVTEENRAAVLKYCADIRKMTERERIANQKPTGVFTGAYAVNPFSGKEIPIWIADYVLAGYGSGAIMAVPAHDSRDYAFAKCFDLPIVPIIANCDISSESYDAKEGTLCNSSFLDGLPVKKAIARSLQYICEKNIGCAKTNYRLRDAVFSRQRYWGEPFPVYYCDGIPHIIPEEFLPLKLPAMNSFLPAENGGSPLERAEEWAWDTRQNKVVNNSEIDGVNVFPLETDTMPGFAGSSAYYLRYMNPDNNECLVSEKNVNYWKKVDLYIGGMEHATGHLIYSRFWCKFLSDCGFFDIEEPYKKMVNQGMIQGRSSFAYRIAGTNTFVSAQIKDKYETQELHVDISLVEKDFLDIERFKKWRSEYSDAEFILEDGKYLCGSAVEKMSKSMYNVVNPNDIVDKYGADTLRMYVMFLGPLELSKPWDINGIEGVHRFLRKLWKLFFDGIGNFSVLDEELTSEEQKIIHRTVKKIRSDIENFSFNTAVSTFMICINELMEQNCRKREALHKLTLLLAPFAPHIAEELWFLLGGNESVCLQQFPDFDESYLTESSFEYPISFNGKVRFKKRLALCSSESDIRQQVLADAAVQKILDGKEVRKFIFIEGRIINVVY